MAHAATYDNRVGGRTPAQWYCLLAGLALLLAGILGFIADSSFDTGDALQGDTFIGFEVNAIHNLVHVASGLVLLASAFKRASARAVAIAFGLVYGVVAVIGLIDGSDVLGLIPINGPDNVLHVGLAVLGIAAGLMSSGDDRERRRTAVGSSGETRFDRGRGATAGTERSSVDR